MLTVKLICVGDLKEKYWRDACAEYAKRLQTLCKFSIIQLKEAKMDKNPSQSIIDKALEEEGKAILQAAEGSLIVPLCIEGKLHSSESLAKLLDNAAVRGESSVAFIIGSSHGLAPAVKKAGTGISMSPMTFPHQLARVMLCEQIYRAFQINTGTKYHK